VTDYIHSFPPIARPDAQRLILGSMPGIASLEAQQYYAHPRNAFWQIMQAVLGMPAGLSYEERVEQLLSHRIATWDVLKTCTRSGSLDSAIDSSTMVVNDFASFFASHPHIELVCFNGTHTYDVWRKHIARTLPEPFASIPTLRLPSTSPAHASLSLAEKVIRWKQGLGISDPR
jgi:TDG/mug DNA glycosylase family protein